MARNDRARANRTWQQPQRMLPVLSESRIEYRIAPLITFDSAYCACPSRLAINRKSVAAMEKSIPKHKPNRKSTMAFCIALPIARSVILTERLDILHILGVNSAEFLARNVALLRLIQLVKHIVHFTLCIEQLGVILIAQSDCLCHRSSPLFNPVLPLEFFQTSRQAFFRE